MLTINEHSSSSYAPRTYYNAKSAQITLAFAVDFHTAGEKLTKKASTNYLALDLNEDWIVNARKIYSVLHKNNLTAINIAGNGIYTLKKYGLNQEDVDVYVLNALSKVHQHHIIQKIYTGVKRVLTWLGLKQDIN